MPDTPQRLLAAVMQHYEVANTKALCLSVMDIVWYECFEPLCVRMCMRGRCLSAAFLITRLTVTPQQGSGCCLERLKRP